MKKVLSLSLALLMTLSLTACKDKQPSASAEPSVSGGKEIIEINYWHGASGVMADVLTEIIEEYNTGRGAERGYHVNPVYQGYEGTNKLILAYQTKDVNNAPDVGGSLTSVIPSMLEISWTVPAADCWERFGGYVQPEDFSDAFRNAVSYQGRMVGLPNNCSTLLMYCNMDALAEAGFDRAPETFDELIEYTKALTEKDAAGNVTRYGFECEVKRYQLTNFIIRQSPDAYFYDNKGGRSGIATQVIAGEEGTLKKALEKMDALLETGGYNYIEDSVMDEFANKKAAIVFASCSRTFSTYDLIGDSFEWQTFPIPAINPGDTGSTGVGGSCIEVFDLGDEKRLEAAWDFAQYLCTPDSSYRMGTHSGYVPVNKNTTALPEMQAFWEEHPQMKVPFDILDKATENSTEPMEPVYNEANTVITDAIRAFCDRDLTVDQTVDAIVNGVNKLLDDWHQAND